MFIGALITLLNSSPARAQEAVVLWHRPELLSSVELPPHSREHLPEGVIPVDGRWRLVASGKGVRTWQVELPVRPRTLVFTAAPEGMEVVRRKADQDWSEASSLGHRPRQVYADRAGSWEFTSSALRVKRKASEGPPKPGEYGLRYDASLGRERALQREAFTGSDAEFVFRSVQVGDTTESGLFLPAPGALSFRLVVPVGAVLELGPRLVPPEVHDPQGESDGVTLAVRINGELLSRRRIEGITEKRLRLDLDRWAGQQVQLSFQSEADADNRLDYLFLASPIIRVPQETPPRVVVVFVDTLRRDALSLYGYHRQTSPNLDAWAEGAAVFEGARSVAPWTLPTARAMFTGAQPERWSEVRTLQEQAAAQGWATAFLAGNIYLSSTFEMDRGWGLHRFLNLPRANLQLRRARAWLDSVADQPSLLVVHLMDAHLPYNEPRAFRHRFAGEQPAGLGPERFVRRHVLDAEERLGADELGYVRDRYDNNIAWIDDQLGGFLRELRPQDLVVVLSDHGEEFWEHGEFEHGHSLYDELLAVPLVVSGPGIASGRYSQPVSLLDLAPTLATHMGLSTAGMDGRPLQDLLDGSAAEAFAQRPIGFGRLLYGERLWGVAHQGTKLITGRGAEELYALSADAKERADVFPLKKALLPGLTEAMVDALGMEVATVLRLVPSRSNSERELQVVLQVPGGVRQAWAAEDPMGLSEVEVNTRVDSEVSIVWQGRARSEREVYVLPNLPLEQAIPSITGTVQHRSARVELSLVPGPNWPPPWDGQPRPLLRGRSGGRTLTVDYARVPVPSATLPALSGVDAEVNEDLRALGYVE